MNILKPIIALVATSLLLLSFSGCDKKSDSGSKGGKDSSIKKASSITLADFDTSDVKLTQAELVENINTSESFFVDSPLTPDVVCINKLLKQEVETTDVGDGTYTVDISELDVTKCSSDYVEMKSSFHLDGLLAPIPKGTYEAENITQSRQLSVYEGTLKIDGHTYTMKSYFALTASDFNNPCIFNSATKSCHQYSKTITNSKEIDYYAFDTEYLISTNLVTQRNKDIYYSSGTIDFTINNWKGTMSYTGPNTAPTYTASSDTESMSGRFGESTPIAEKVAKMDISSASSILIAPTTAKLAPSRSGSKNANTVYIITNSGKVQEVTYLDRNGDKVTEVPNPVYVENIDSTYILIAFDTYPTVTYLVRKSDGAMYDIGVSLYLDSWQTFYNKVLRKDNLGNLYFLVDADLDLSDYSSRTDILKLDISDPNALTKMTINSDIDEVSSFEVDGNGNVIFQGSRADTDAGNTYSKIIKANGSSQNIAETDLFWKGLDNVLYSDANDVNGTAVIKKHQISNNFTYTPTDIPYAKTQYCSLASYSSNLIQTTATILITSDNGDICEVYNQSMVPRVFSSGMSSFTGVGKSEKYYYISGNDSSYAPVLRKFNPIDDTHTDLLKPGKYDVYKFNVSPTDEITFNALRMNDSTKVLGSIASDGTVTILDSTANVKAILLKRIN